MWKSLEWFISFERHVWTASKYYEKEKGTHFYLSRIFRDDILHRSSFIFLGLIRFVKSYRSNQPFCLTRTPKVVIICDINKLCEHLLGFFFIDTALPEQRVDTEVKKYRFTRWSPLVLFTGYMACCLLAVPAVLVIRSAGNTNSVLLYLAGTHTSLYEPRNFHFPMILFAH